MIDKINDHHLSRSAFVYIRQSTLQQVRNNTESGRRQYALEGRARDLGFKTVVVIDEDLGISGTGSHEQPGFAKLLAAVCNGEVGAVFALEASRFAALFVQFNGRGNPQTVICLEIKLVLPDKTGMKSTRLIFNCLLFYGLFLASIASAVAEDNPYLGYWSLHIPGGGPGWLGVSGPNDDLKVQMLWGGGSVFPVNSAQLADGKLILTRRHQADRKAADGQPVVVTETITATLDGRDNLKLVTATPKEDGGENRAEFTGHRQAPPPPAPDLGKIKLGSSIVLFNGTNLDGLKPVEPNAFNGWHAEEGLLVNTQKQEPGQEHRSFANLRTVAEFEDFSLHAEVRVPKNGNSGIYIRGTDEVQIFDSYGKPLDAHNMGAIYSRITPTAAAEKPAGEWQTVDILYVARHATVTLNGTKIIDNQPVIGPTGGALWPEMDRPGPIYLQGDHTGIEYRNLVLRPVISE